MRKLRVLVLILGVLLLSASVAQAKTHPVRTYLFDPLQTDHVGGPAALYKPTMLWFSWESTPIVVENIHWRDWGTAHAIGSGTAIVIFVGGGSATRRAHITVNRPGRFLGHACGAVRSIAYYRGMHLRLRHAGGLLGLAATGGRLPENFAAGPPGANCGQAIL